MTPKQLVEIKARWMVEGQWLDLANISLFTQAYEDIPALLTEVERLRGERDALRAACLTLMVYEDSMDGADGDGEEQEPLYWQAVKLARAALGKNTNTILKETVK